MIILSYFSFFFNEKFEKKLMVTLQRASVKPHLMLFANQTLSSVSTERERWLFLIILALKLFRRDRSGLFFANLPGHIRNKGNRCRLIQNNQYLVDSRELVGKRAQIFSFPFWQKGETNLPVKVLYSLRFDMDYKGAKERKQEEDRWKSKCELWNVRI